MYGSDTRIYGVFAVYFTLALHPCTSGTLDTDNETTQKIYSFHNIGCGMPVYVIRKFGIREIIERKR